MADIVKKALECVTNSDGYFYKFLSPNDVGSNGSNQSGVYIHFDDGKKLFPKSFQKGENVHADIQVLWYDSKLTSICNFIYYGKALGTEEFRITRLNRKFVVGDFLLLVLNSEEYIGFVLNDEQSKEFLTGIPSIK
ncbi:EcoRII N-terminal effector-binding domain-containing protein [Sphingobacterium luzhongxinii]|uniref:EcoRII N-terminal effector-binding domain-containing protein n=1 Tax=Sphingobacterium luzhongxinii TaxID=2654181 RepID=UPI0013DC26BD|nr:EcoRII N-terminal effector-binding domain-containing protein [Sphingobacterium sp. xlx-73]